MNTHLQSLLLKTTGADSISSTQVIQTLWSGYGEIVRVGLAGGTTTSVILKHISLPEGGEHPRDWNTSLSHQRKLKSYDVELNWYHDWSANCDEHCRVAAFYASENVGKERVIILEDLDASGFSLRRSSLGRGELRACLRWLAAFHARFMGVGAEGLWETGTYWHLATRPDEYAIMEDGDIKRAATTIDRLLNRCQHQTLVHGDAKVANFCFTEDLRQIAAVDFQYVGGGCGIKDVAYFMGSCLSESECECWQDDILDGYFAELRQALIRYDSAADPDAVEQEWRRLFPVAWTDFYRFLLGWAPDHPKIHRYTRSLAEQTLAQLS